MSAPVSWPIAAARSPSVSRFASRSGASLARAVHGALRAREARNGVCGSTCRPFAEPPDAARRVDHDLDDDRALDILDEGLPAGTGAE